MLDQSFSAKNFRKIFDYENRKGVYLEGKFFPNLEQLTKQIKQCTGEIKQHRKSKEDLDFPAFENRDNQLNKSRDELKFKKEVALMKELEKISSEITSKNFSLGIQELDLGLNKAIYSAGASAVSYFALKQLQYNIRRLYKVKQGNRHNIICQIRELLRDNFPKYIVRTDLSGFYESIPRAKLLNKIQQDSLLTITSKKLIKQVLYEYGESSGNPSGVPRGIGVSAYLSEFYMRKFDELMTSFPGVLYYSRYVDDIFMIFTPAPNQGTRLFRKFFAKTLDDFGLIRNRDKTNIHTCDGETVFTLDFLGYKFVFGRGRMELRLSNSKIVRYKARVKIAVEEYRKHAVRHEKRAGQLLLKRIKFLTGNTRLVNNKKNVVVGIYFSNGLLTHTSDIKTLDLYLQRKAARLPNQGLRHRLKDFSFMEGFEKKVFHKFSAKQMQKITETWKHEA